MEIQALEEKARLVRQDIIRMTSMAGSGHPGGSLSATDTLVALYFEIMNVDPADEKNPDRDRFVLSKGHAAPALYGTLCERGYFPREHMETFRQLHSILQGHPDVKKCPGVDASTGSLGQGISMAAGMALAAKHLGKKNHVYTMIGDGESQEGLVWEASMAAAHYKLDNLTVILDHNGLQIDGSNDEVMSLGDIKAKALAFGYDVIEVADGNDMRQVLDALRAPACPGKPRYIIMNTIKGKGVSYMENQVGWHGKAPDAELAARALKELEG
ncbi:MAG: transketolase [Clostridia bacterium]|nr:transketolase [Clostridia bacterium]